MTPALPWGITGQNYTTIHGILTMEAHIFVHSLNDTFVIGFLDLLDCVSRVTVMTKEPVLRRQLVFSETCRQTPNFIESQPYPQYTFRPFVSFLFVCLFVLFSKFWILMFVFVNKEPRRSNNFKGYIPLTASIQFQQNGKFVINKCAQTQESPEVEEL